MIGNAARFGPRNRAARLRGRRTESWVPQLIRRIRNGAVRPPDGSAAAVVAGHRNRQGHLLPGTSAVVELLNILRPTVAVPPLARSGAVLRPAPERQAR